MANLTLRASVGSGGVNNAADVTALKQHMIGLGYDWLTPDDTVDEELVRTINLIQSIRKGEDTIRGDGRVDVPGPTYNWLRAQNAPRWQQMPAGSTTAGFINIERTPQGDDHGFGTDWMAFTIRGAGSWYRHNYQAANPGAALITINDVSPTRAGSTNNHAGHQTGLACDLRLPRTDSTAPGKTTFRDAVYDQAATRAMLQAVRQQPHVDRILFNDPDLIAEGLCQRADEKHDNHVHFEIAPLQPILGYEEPVDDILRRAITHFGGSDISPTDHPMTETGFQTYLDAVGVRHFSAREMVTPNQENIAMHLGYINFLPPHDWWLRGAALALFADELRNLVGEPVKMRNWWRPPIYNRHSDVGGEEDGDHPTAHGVDLDYRSANSRRKAEHRIKEIAVSEPWLALSFGLGNTTTHVGIASPRGGRSWKYSSYVP